MSQPLTVSCKEPQTTSLNERNKIVDAFSVKAEKNLSAFCSMMDHSYLYADHLNLIDERLEAVERGDIKRLMVFMPPRHGKSEKTSIKYPAWFLGRNPEKRIIHSSYSYDLSEHFTAQARDLVDTDKYRLVFPDVRLNPKKASSKSWGLVDPKGRRLKGGMVASGVGGAITGYGANLFIIDDVVKNQEEAESETIREKIWEWYRFVVRTRIEPSGAIIIILTRWHQEDLAGKIIDDEKSRGVKDWEILTLECECESGDDPLGRRPKTNKRRGETLWPDRYPEEEMFKTLEEVGSRARSALYQQNPQDPKTKIIREEWIRDTKGYLSPESVRFGGVDVAANEKESSTESAIVDVHRTPEGYLDVHEIHMDHYSTNGLAKTMIFEHGDIPYERINIESNNAGHKVKTHCDEISRIEGANLPLVEVLASNDKVQRVKEFEPLVENGTIRFNLNSKKVKDMVRRLCRVPQISIWDDIDALGHAIKAAQKTRKKVDVNDLRYYEDKPDTFNYMIIKPFIYKKEQSAKQEIERGYSYILVFGIDVKEEFYVMDIWREKCGLDKLFEEVISRAKIFNPIESIGYEFNAYKRDKDALSSFFATKKFYPVVNEFNKRRMTKDDRVSRLVPYIAKNKIFLPQCIWNEVEGANYKENLVEGLIQDDLMRFPYEGDGSEFELADLLSSITEKEDLSLSTPVYQRETKSSFEVPFKNIEDRLPSMAKRRSKKRSSYL